MRAENESEYQEPEELMSDKRFMSIYKILRESGLSNEEIAQFVKKYHKGGMGTVKAKDAQHQEKEEFYQEVEKEKKELEGRVKDMANEELRMYSEKYYGEFRRRYKEGDTVFWTDRFLKELNRRQEVKGKKEEEEIEKIKSKIPEDQPAIERPILEEKKQEEKPKKKWWQFWKE